MSGIIEKVTQAYDEKILSISKVYGSKFFKFSLFEAEEF